MKSKHNISWKLCHFNMFFYFFNNLKNYKFDLELFGIVISFKISTFCDRYGKRALINLGSLILFSFNIFLFINMTHYKYIDLPTYNYKYNPIVLIPLFIHVIYYSFYCTTFWYN